MATEASATILIVDDAPENLVVLSELLRPHYRVLAATSGEAGIRVAGGQSKPDLILLDVMMPGMDGYATLAKLQANPATRNIPVVFLTALVAATDEEHGLQLGAADYITKPIQPAVVMARVRTQLQAKQARDWMADQNATLEAEVARRMQENNLTRMTPPRSRTSARTGPCSPLHWAGKPRTWRGRSTNSPSSRPPTPCAPCARLRQAAP